MGLEKYYQVIKSLRDSRELKKKFLGNQVLSLWITLGVNPLIERFDES